MHTEDWLNFIRLECGYDCSHRHRIGSGDRRPPSFEKGAKLDNLIGLYRSRCLPEIAISSLVSWIGQTYYQNGLGGRLVFTFRVGF